MTLLFFVCVLNSADIVGADSLLCSVPTYGSTVALWVSRVRILPCGPFSILSLSPPFTFCQISTVLSRKKKTWYLLWIKYSYFAFFLILRLIIFIQLAIAFFVNMVHSQLPCSILSKYWQPFRSSYICQNFVINIYCEFLHWDENGNASRWLFLCFANFSVCNAECPGWILNILGNVLIHQGIPCLQIISYSTCFRK